MTMVFLKYGSVTTTASVRIQLAFMTFKMQFSYAPEWNTRFFLQMKKGQKKLIHSCSQIVDEIIDKV